MSNFLTNKKPFKSRKGHIVNKRGRECTICGIYKEWSEFHHDKASKTGHLTNCKTCAAKKQKDKWNKKHLLPEITSGDTRKCTDCGKTKPIEEFRKRRKDYGGGHYQPCKQCHNRVAPVSDNPIEFDFLLNLSQRMNKNAWTVEQINYLLMNVKELHDKGETNFDLAYRRSAKPKSGCVNILKEIKRLAEHNQKNPAKRMDLVEYFKAGRPFHKDNLVIVEGKK